MYLYVPSNFMIGSIK